MSVTAESEIGLDHFREWCSHLILDNEEPFILEPFQEAFAADLFLGKPANWLLVPEGNGKSTFVAALALYHVAFKTTAYVPVAASSRDQAEILYRQAEGFIFRSNLHQMKPQEGYRRIKCDLNGSRIQIYAADARTGDGVIPTLALIDELHQHRNMKLYRTWLGKLAKRNGQLITISTAGEPNSEFELVRAEMREKGEVEASSYFIRAITDNSVLHDWALHKGDPEDFEQVAMANPFSGVTAEALEAKRSLPGMTPQHWKRFVCNVPTLTVESWLKPGVWEGLQSDAEIPEGSPIYVGLDLAWSNDATAVVQVYPGDRYVCRSTIFQTWQHKNRSKPLAHEIFEGDRQNHRAIIDHILGIHKRNPITELVYDPAGATLMIEELEANGITCVEMPQTAKRMCSATDILTQLIHDGQITHDGDPFFSAHMANATTKWVGDGIRLWKTPDRASMDSAIALAIAIARAYDGSSGEFHFFAL